MVCFSKLFDSVVAYENFGGRVRAMREACGLTQEDLAKKLKVSRKTVGQYEAGTSKKALASFATWEKLAEAFSTPERKVSVAILLGLTIDCK